MLEITAKNHRFSSGLMYVRNRVCSDVFVPVATFSPMVLERVSLGCTVPSRSVHNVHNAGTSVTPTLATNVYSAPIASVCSAATCCTMSASCRSTSLPSEIVREKNPGVLAIVSYRCFCYE
eukprot:m.160724 g.160724  ORF g.160724 m.160724 type:complete len:121 (+) comp18037_c1_seq2:33-395(+)